MAHNACLLLLGARQGPSLTLAGALHTLLLNKVLSSLLIKVFIEGIVVNLRPPSHFISPESCPAPDAEKMTQTHTHLGLTRQSPPLLPCIVKVNQGSTLGLLAL